MRPLHFLVGKTFVLCLAKNALASLMYTFSTLNYELPPFWPQRTRILTSVSAAAAKYLHDLLRFVSSQNICNRFSVAEKYSEGQNGFKIRMLIKGKNGFKNKKGSKKVWSVPLASIFFILPILVSYLWYSFPHILSVWSIFYCPFLDSLYPLLVYVNTYRFLPIYVLNNQQWVFTLWVVKLNVSRFGRRAWNASER